MAFHYSLMGKVSALIAERQQRAPKAHRGRATK